MSDHSRNKKPVPPLSVPLAGRSTTGWLTNSVYGLAVLDGCFSGLLLLFGLVLSAGACVVWFSAEENSGKYPRDMMVVLIDAFCRLFGGKDFHILGSKQALLRGGSWAGPETLVSHPAVFVGVGTYGVICSWLGYLGVQKKYGGFIKLYLSYRLLTNIGSW